VGCQGPFLKAGIRDPSGKARRASSGIVVRRAATRRFTLAGLISQATAERISGLGKMKTGEALASFVPAPLGDTCQAHTHLTGKPVNKRR
jgi:hypothetical protein